MNAIDLLVGMHNETKAKFGQILQADGDEAGRMWEELKPELKVHEEMELSYLLRPLEEDGTLEYESHHQEEVAEVQDLIMQTAQHRSSSPEWRELIQRIRAELEHHMEEEELDVFPRARETWSEERLDKAGRLMDDLRQQRLRAA